MKTALILIDIQNDYFPGGSFELVGQEAAGERAAFLLNAARENNIPVVHIQHINPPGAPFFLPDTDGMLINDCVTPLPTETVIQKNFPNSFRETTLQKHLQDLEIKRLVFGGSMSQMCIDFTTRAAFDLGYDCIVAHDACATRDLMTPWGDMIDAASVHASFMAALTMVMKLDRAEEVAKVFEETEEEEDAN